MLDRSELHRFRCRSGLAPATHALSAVPSLNSWIDGCFQKQSNWRRKKIMIQKTVHVDWLYLRCFKVTKVRIINDMQTSLYLQEAVSSHDGLRKRNVDVFWSILMFRFGCISVLSTSINVTVRKRPCFLSVLMIRNYVSIFSLKERIQWAVYCFLTLWTVDLNSLHTVQYNREIWWQSSRTHLDFWRYCHKTTKLVQQRLRCNVRWSQDVHQLLQTKETTGNGF